MMGLALDFRHALRALVRHRAFSLTAIAAIAIGIGASTAVFSVVYSMVFRPLPWRGAERIVSMTEVFQMDGRELKGGFELGKIREMAERSKTLEAIGGYMTNVSTLNGFDEPRRLESARVTAGVFDVMRARAKRGRLFESDEVEAGNQLLAVLSEGAFQKHFDGDDSKVGGPLRINGELYTLLGVLPDDFGYPNRATELWTPLVWNDPSQDPDEERHISVPAVARLAEGYSIEQATTEAGTLFRALGEEDRAQRETRRAQRAAPMMDEGEDGERHESDDHGAEVAAAGDHDGDPGEGGPKRKVMRREMKRPESELLLTSLQEQQTERFRPALRALAVAVALVFLIACANVANLLLSRGLHRQRELATRAALGSQRGGLLRALLSESALLCLAGTVLGIGLAALALRLVVRLDPGDIPRLAEIGLYPPVLLFAVILAILATAIFAIVPLAQISSSQLTTLLGRDGGPGAGHKTKRSWIRGGLAVAEIALALILLIGAGLLARSFVTLTSVDPGFDSEGTMTGFIAAPTATYPPGPQRTQFFESYLERVRAIPGVSKAGLVNFLPPVEGRIVLAFQIEGRPQPNDPREMPQGDLRVVTPGYLEAMGIPVAAGRSFDETDRADGPRRLLINQELAKRFFPDEDPVGKNLAMFGEIIGVVGNVKSQGYDSLVQPTFYVALAQAPAMFAPIFERMAIVVRGGDPSALGAALRSRLRELDPAVALDDVKPMSERMADSVALPRFYAGIMTVFALVALALAVLGIYGVMSYSVSQETKETGVRLALGAQGSQVLARALWRGLRLTLIGIAVGVAGALALTRLVEGMLFEVPATDPLTFAAISVLLVFTALIASLIPARRAALTDPLTALRQE